MAYIKTYDRDLQLDIYRALLMIYIICVIHTAYWFGLMQWPWNSIILFEMPLIFFISGASVAVSPVRHGLKGTLWSRFKRVVLPYYAYVLFLVALLTAIDCTAAIINSSHIQARLNGRMIRDLLLFSETPFLSFDYCYHLWFIKPYLTVSCLFPLYRKLADRLPRMLTVSIMLIICISSFILTENESIRNVTVYTFFFIIGYLYYRRTGIKKIALALTACTCVSIAYLWHVEWRIPEMQYHKFPPDMIFLTFGLNVLLLFSLLLSYIRLPFTPMMRRWHASGYTLYLWQNYYFLLVGLIVNGAAFIGFSGETASTTGSGIPGFLTAAILLFATAITLRRPIVWYENAVTGIISKTIKSMTRIVDRILGKPLRNRH